MKRILAKGLAAVLLIGSSTGCFALASCGSDQGEPPKTNSVGEWVNGIYETDDKEKTLNYSVFVPSSASDDNALPLLHWIGDATTANVPVVQQRKSPDHNGMAVEMASSEAVQKEHPSFVLVVQYTETGNQGSDDGYGEKGYVLNDAQYTAEIVEYICSQYNIDEDRMYLTGQSAGCMASFEINYRNPNLFAATYYVAGHWELERVIGTLQQQTWAFTASENGKTEYELQNTLKAMLYDQDGQTYETVTVSAKSADAAQSDAAIREMLDKGDQHNFILLQAGTLSGTAGNDVPGTAVAAAHTNTWRSKPGAYTFLSVYDWLFAQTRSGGITTTYGTDDELIVHPAPGTFDQSGGRR